MYKRQVIALFIISAVIANGNRKLRIRIEMCIRDRSMRGVSYMDISGAITFMQVLSELQKQGKKVFLCGVPGSTMNMLKRSGIYDMIGENNFYWSCLLYTSGIFRETVR